MSRIRNNGSKIFGVILVLLLASPLTGCAIGWPWGDSETEQTTWSPATSAGEPIAAAAGVAASRVVRNSLGMEFVLIPPGEFIMGGRNSAATQPRRRVRISRPIYMGRFPVTQAEWQRIMGDNPSWNSGCGSCPVEQVSYLDVLNFLEKLNAMDRGTYRLPTEAEWEYAARAGTTGTYSFGDDPSQLGAYGWFFRNVDSGAQPVGQKRPNPWGLYDMHGNVWEWVRDWHQPYPATRTVVNPVGPARGKYKVIRGGSWTNDFDLCRSATRMKVRPRNEHLNLGFRVVLVPGGAG